MAAAGDKSKGNALKTIDLDGHDLPPSPAPSTPRNGRRYALATELVYTESSDQYNASSMPIYQVTLSLSMSILSFLADSYSPRPSSKHPLAVMVDSMTTHAPAIPHVPTSNAISPRS
jgi:hypothetical protein